jgi:DNA-binding response OmpR family regulator
MRNSIMVVEDEPGILDAIQMILEMAGYRVQLYADGTDILAGNYVVPDLFILDRQLPGVDGLDVCRSIKSSDRSKDVPVIVFSASSKSKESALAAGADGFLEKPFRKQALLDAVARFLEKPEVDKPGVAPLK